MKIVGKFVEYILESDLGSKDLDVILAGHHDLIHVPVKIQELVQSSIVASLSDSTFAPRIASTSVAFLILFKMPIDAFDESLGPLNKLKELLEEKVVSNTVQKCCDLNKTRGVPREYRGTRRPVSLISI